MKKQIIRTIIILALSAFFIDGYSQITVTKIENKNVNTSNDGFIYTLPQTVIKIDIVYEKHQQIKGPLSDYATEYLGISDYIPADKTEYNLLNVSVSTSYEADPNQLYYVQYPIVRSKDEKPTSFSLSSMGGLISFNTEPQIEQKNEEITSEQTLIFNTGNKKFPYMSQYNQKEKIDTIVKTINIDTVTINRFLFRSSWIDKSIDDKASDAAKQIENIRESRYHLMSGYQEVNYGASIKYMDEQLHKLEIQYLELFLGKEVSSVGSKTMYFVPNNSNKSGELIKFSDGSSVSIKIIPDNTSDMLADKPSSGLNKIYYRIPANADVKVNFGDKVFYNGRFLFNQLGSVATAPLENTKLQFDETTGNIISIDRK